jgi:hypothetical protein
MVDFKLATTHKRHVALIGTQVASRANDQLMLPFIEQDAELGEPNEDPKRTNNQAGKRAEKRGTPCAPKRNPWAHTEQSVGSKIDSQPENPDSKRQRRDPEAQRKPTGIKKHNG